MSQEGDSLEEGAPTDEHDDVDGVEVPLAAKASSEIGFWIGSGVELVAAGAEKTQDPLAMLGGELEGVRDHVVYRNVIS